MLARMMNDLNPAFGNPAFGPFAPLMRLRGEMDRLFENFFEDLPSARPYGAGYPGVNLWEEGDSAYLEAELPGLTLDDVEVYVTGNEVAINGQRRIGGQEDAKQDGVNWHRRERSQGRFSRTMTLPWEIDADKVEARLQDGVLTVKLPKCESCKPRKVKVLTE